MSKPQLTPQHRNKYLLLIFTILLIGSISAYSSLTLDFEIMTQKQNTCFDFPATCDNCTYMNITILYPNGEIIVDNQAMTNLTSRYYYNYSFCETSKLGSYPAILNYDEEEYGDVYSDFYFFEITKSGKESPSGIVIVVFSILFLVIIAFLLQFIIYTLMFFVEYNFSKKEGTPKGERPIFGMREFIINISGFLILLVFNALSRNYLGNDLVNHILSLSILICSWTNVFFPIIALIISFTIATWKEVAGLGAVTKW